MLKCTWMEGTGLNLRCSGATIYKTQNYFLVCSVHQWRGSSFWVWTRAWMLPEAFESRKAYNNHMQKNCSKQCCDIQFWRQVISWSTADAERPVLHLKPIIHTVHGGTRLQNKELQIIVKVQKKVWIFLQTIVHLVQKVTKIYPSENLAKLLQNAWHFVIFMLHCGKAIQGGSYPNEVAALKR